jgi:transcriptional regulator with XRE-family HTH domain
LDREGASAADFGRLLRSRRVVAELTQEELAQKSGVSVRALSDMETGRTCQPRMSSVRLLADAMGLSGVEREDLIQAASGAGGRLNAGLAADAAVPRQLPAGVPGFTGRAAELAVLDGLLDQAAGCGAPVVISAIGGTAGVGKTALATYWAHQVADRFPDGQLYVNLRGFGPSGTPVSAAAAVRLFLDGLGIEPERIPAGLDARAALYRSVLAGRRMLIVADNARDPEQVRPLLPGTPGCLVVVTSRNQLAGLAAAEGARLISLDVLTEPEALELLSRRLGRRAAAEPGAVGGAGQAVR